METSRLGESPSRFPSSDLPCTLIRSILPCSVFSSLCAITIPAVPSRTASIGANLPRIMIEPPSESLHLLDVPRHVDYRDPLAAPDIEQRLEHGRALVVKKVVIPVPFHQLWN